MPWIETLASSTATPLIRALPTTHTLSWTRRHAIDAVKRPFSEELVERIKNIIDPAQIDVLMCNHIEIDHSGSVPHIMAHALLDGFLVEGIPVQLIDLKETHISNVMYHFLDSKHVCVDRMK